MKASIAAISDVRQAPDDSEALTSESFEWCRRVSRARARNFYYGMKLTPPDTRRSMHAVYAWMRAADDLADNPSARNGQALTVGPRLEALRRLTHRMIDAPEMPDPCDTDFAPMWPAVRETFRSHRIPIDYLDAMIDGQLLDASAHTYHTFDDLYDYCYKVASVVGLTCVEVWGHDDDDRVCTLAEHRGIAFQLTNILRDVVEDSQRGRTYLPQEDFDSFGLSPDQIKKGQADQAFDRFMAYQIQRAQSYYDRSMDLEQHLNQSCRAASWAMMRTYHDLLGRIRKDPRRVLHARVRLSAIRKSSIVLTAALRRAF